LTGEDSEGGKKKVRDARTIKKKVGLKTEDRGAVTVPSWKHTEREREFRFNGGNRGGKKKKKRNERLNVI